MCVCVCVCVSVPACLCTCVCAWARGCVFMWYGVSFVQLLSSTDSLKLITTKRDKRSSSVGKLFSLINI